MRLLVLLGLAAVLAGCASEDGQSDPDRRWLNVVPSSGEPHILEWPDLDDSSAAADLVERGLQAAAGSAYGSSSRELNATEIAQVRPWISAHENVHNVHPLPIRYDGRLYRVGLDGMA